MTRQRANLSRSRGIECHALLCLGLCQLSFSLPSYAQDVPHGARFPAAGHGFGSAGGPLSAFGRDFATTQGSWAALCLLDSDRDGETNGQELGDPCCRWPAKELAGALALSDPSDSAAVSGTAACPAAELALASADDVAAAVDPEALDVIAHVEPLPGPPSWGHYASALALLALLLQSCSRDIVTLLEPRVLLATAVGAAVWVELAGGVVHILLDNPALRSWGSCVGSLATQFQEHHQFPAQLASEPCSAFLVKYAPIVALFSFTLRALLPRSLRCRAFLLCVNFFWHLSLLSHRWAHAATAGGGGNGASPRAAITAVVPPAAAGGRGGAEYGDFGTKRPLEDDLAMLPVRWLQRAHLLMSPEHHDVHHNGFDSRFAMLNGIGNILLLDPMLAVLPSTSLLWLVVLFMWAILLPFALLGAHDTKSALPILFWRHQLPSCQRQRPRQHAQ